MRGFSLFLVVLCWHRHRRGSAARAASEHRGFFNAGANATFSKLATTFSLLAGVGIDC